MRVVLDVNVLIAGLLSNRGAPAEIIRRWLAGEFELIVSDELLRELERALSYPKVLRHVPDAAAVSFLSLLRASAVTARDPGQVPRRSADPGDGYLIALAEQERSILVSGDRHLLDLAAELPIESARTFLQRLGSSG